MTDQRVMMHIQEVLPPRVTEAPVGEWKDDPPLEPHRTQLGKGKYFSAPVLESADVDQDEDTDAEIARITAAFEKAVERHAKSIKGETPISRYFVIPLDDDQEAE